MAAATEWTEEDTQRALKFWEEYQKTHDVSALHGKAVGIDPDGRRVWFGEDARDVRRKADADGAGERMLCTRVGLGYYARKGGRR